MEKSFDATIATCFLHRLLSVYLKPLVSAAIVPQRHGMQFCASMMQILSLYCYEYALLEEFVNLSVLMRPRERCFLTSGPELTNMIVMMGIGTRRISETPSAYSRASSGL
jgi:hypothetical protein